MIGLPASPAAPLPRLRVDLDHRTDLLRRLLVDTLHGGLFVPSEAEHAAGQNVILDLRLPGLPDGVRLAGVVRWRQPPRPPERSRWGLAVELLASEWRRRDFLIDVATGGLQRRRVASRRIPARLRVMLRLPAEGGPPEEEHPGVTRDVGRGGVFVGELGGAMERLTTGTVVEVELPGTSPLRVPGRIAWQGSDAEGPGLGVAFQFRGEADRQGVLQWVAALEDRLAGAG